MALRNILPSHRGDVSPSKGQREPDRSKKPSAASQQPGHHTGHGKHVRRARSGFTLISHDWHNPAVAALAEFSGTFMFLFFAFGGTTVANNSTQANSPDASPGIPQAPNVNLLLYISLVFGFSLMINVWIFFRVSGGLFNPAVTLGLFLIGSVSSSRAILCFISQMLAGMAAAGVVSAILPGPLSVSTTLGNGVSVTRGIFLEMFLTSLLVFTVFMLAAEKHKATFLAPVGIGIALFVAELLGVFFTGGSLNPARSFGPCVVTRDFPGYHYIYWIGPLMGTLLAFAMYKIVKAVDYETVNPGQDFDDHEAALFNPPDNPSDPEQVRRPVVHSTMMSPATQHSDMSTEKKSSDNGEGSGPRGH